MAMIAPEKCDCNNRNPGFSGIFSRSWPGRHFLRTDAAPPTTAPAESPDHIGARLLTEITAQLNTGQDTVCLRQIDLADILRVSAVTVRRHTRRLQEAGLLLARRGRNIISYTIINARRTVDQAIADSQPRLISAPSNESAPTPAPVYVAGITAHKSERRGKSDPKCPSHNKARRSWMSDHVGQDLYHCPATTGPSSHCSWIYAPNIGQIRGPGNAEISLPELRTQFAAASARRGPSADDLSFAPPVEHSEPNTEAQNAWHAITSVMARWTQPADVSTFLRPAKGTAFDGRTLEVTAAQPSHLRWLQQSFAMRFVGQAVKEALGRPVGLRYRIAEAAS